MAKGSSSGEEDEEEEEDLMSSAGSDDLELSEDERWQRTYQQLLDLAEELIDLAREEPDQEVEAPPPEDLASGLEELGLPPKNQQELQVFIEFLDSACKEKALPLDAFLGKLRGGGPSGVGKNASSSASASASSGPSKNLPPLPTTPNFPSSSSSSGGGGASRWPAGDVDLDAATKEEERRSRRSSLADAPSSRRNSRGHLDSAASLPSSTWAEPHASSAASLPGSTRVVFPNADSYVAAPPISETRPSPGVTSLPMSDLAESRRTSITPSEPLASPREPAWLTGEELQRLAEWSLPTMLTSASSSNACEDLHRLLQEMKTQVSSVQALIPGGGPLQRIFRKLSEALERAQALSIRGAEEMESLVNAVGRHQEEASRQEAKVKKLREDLRQVEDQHRQSNEESQQQEDVARKCRSELQSCQEKLKRLEQEKKGFESSCRHLEEQVRQVQQQARDSQHAGDKARQELETHLEEAAGRSESMRRLEGRVAELELQVKKKEAECKDHEADVARLREELSQESSRHETEAPEMARLRAEVETLKKDVDGKEAHLSKSTSANQRLETQLQEVEERLKLREADCTSQEEDIRRLQGELSEQTGYSNELRRLQDEVSKQEALVEEKEAQRKALEATLQEERAAASEALLKGRSDALQEQEASAKACEELKAALAKAQQDCRKAEAALSQENDHRQQQEDSAAQDVHRMADKLRNAGVENDRLERKVAVQEASLETRLAQLAASQLRARFARRRRSGRGMEASLTPRGDGQFEEVTEDGRAAAGMQDLVVESPLPRS